jgi:heme oxygenase
MYTKTLFSQALLTATYKNGRGGELSEEHKKAEHHRFKTEYLFKNPRISRELYASRLIQHFLIIQLIETQLQNFAQSEEISAFFALSYLEHLWRTPALEQDLQQLNINPNKISPDAITKTTEKYLDELKQLKPKELLAQFLVHVVGFIFGGDIIRSNYIEPSNRLTKYKISTNQYDFSSAASLLSIENPSPLALYKDMISTVDKINIEPHEYEEILKQCKNIYETMANIYDDLYTLHTYQQKRLGYLVAMLSISLAILVVIVSLMNDFSPNSQERQFLARSPY